MVQLNGYQQQDFNDESEYRSSRKSWVFVIILLAIITILGFAIGSSSKNIEVTNTSVPFWQKVANIFTFTEKDDPNYLMPAKEENRLDVLILGIRGENDPNAADGGPLLTDSIMLFSFDKTAKKASIVSLPRDLYLKIDKNKLDKINAAYEYGYYHKSGGISYAKEIFSKITGVYIDKAVVLDFSSFEKIIDEVGGIDIVLAKPFEEKEQWGYGFYLPAGPNHLDGKNALYYARSRFSSNDFDRSRRQQEVIFALKDKLTQLDWLADPIKTLNIATTINSNIKTDFNIWNAKELLDLADEINSAEKIKKYVVSTENLVYESHINNAYVLLPTGDNLTQIKQLFQDIIK